MEKTSFQGEVGDEFPTHCPWCRGEQWNAEAEWRGTCANCGVPWDVEDWPDAQFVDLQTQALNVLMGDRNWLIDRLTEAMKQLEDRAGRVLEMSQKLALARQFRMNGRGH